MTIAVLCKWCPDPADLEVRHDGSVSIERAGWEISEYDRVAIELASAFAAGRSRLVALSVGGRAIDTSLAVKSILSRGPDELVLVVDERLDGGDSRQSGFALAAALQRLGDVELVLTGAGSADLYAQQVGIQVGERLGWPTLNEVSAVAWADSVGALRAERRVGGAVNVLSLTAPAVLALTADAAQPRVPGMRDILAAGKKPTTRWSLDDLGPEAHAPPSSTPRAPRAPQGQERRRSMLVGNPSDTAAQLLAALRVGGAL